MIHRSLAAGVGMMLRGACRLNLFLNRMGPGRLRAVRSMKPAMEGFLIGMFSNRDQMLLTTVNGQMMLIPRRQVSCYAYKGAEPITASLIKKALRPGSTMLDLGAHIGVHSLLAARQVGPEGKVFAFEPSPATFEVLRRNIEINGYSHVEAVPLAASNRTGQQTFHLAEESSRNTFYWHEFCGPVTTCQVQCTTVDAFLAGRPVDVMKIDVEGGEIPVLEGCAETLERNPGLVLFVEINPFCLRAAGRSVRELIAVLTDAGFSLTLIDEHSGHVRPISSPDIKLSGTSPLRYGNLYCVRPAACGW